MTPFQIRVIALGLGACLAFPALGQEGLSEVITRQYDDGGIYEGTFLDGLQHGQGTYRLPNGFEYSG
ncbi:MAG: 2-isopropylmalate synthase, partial [Rhodobacteraceae bacterium]|nr:2-isopropylmalate synthase [Paracoccaceae bacterium]